MRTTGIALLLAGLTLGLAAPSHAQITPSDPSSTTGQRPLVAVDDPVAGLSWSALWRATGFWADGFRLGPVAARRGPRARGVEAVATRISRGSRPTAFRWFRPAGR
jgi:hypothetical protein